MMFVVLDVVVNIGSVLRAPSLLHAVSGLVPWRKGHFYWFLFSD